MEKKEFCVPTNPTYKTFELKLAALLLAEIPDTSFEVYQDAKSIRKTIAITFPKKYEKLIIGLERAFINKQAVSNIYAYNRALNMIRDRLRESDGYERERSSGLYAGLRKAGSA